MMAEEETQLLLPKEREVGWFRQFKLKFNSISQTKLVAVIVGIGLVVGYTALLFSAFNSSSAEVSRLSQSAPRTSNGHVDIRIPQGRLRGYANVSREGRGYFSFFKVPYAAPPLGRL